jgi:hypothetical protein
MLPVTVMDLEKKMEDEEKEEKNKVTIDSNLEPVNCIRITRATSLGVKLLLK